MCGNGCVTTCIHNKASAEAANEIKRLRAQAIMDNEAITRMQACGERDAARLEWLEVQAIRGAVPHMICIPEVEWDSVMTPNVKWTA